jgi:hypothetical protein
MHRLLLTFASDAVQKKLPLQLLPWLHSCQLQMNPERRIVRIGLAAMLSVLVVAAVVLTVHDDFSDSASALLEPAFTDLRIKLPPLPPLTEQQFKSLPPVSTMIYVPPTKTEVKNALARHGVQMHVFKNVRVVMIHKLESISATYFWHVTRDTMDIAKSMFTLDVILSIPHFEPHHALIFMLHCN